MRVILVDDSVTQRNVLGRMLTEGGHEIIGEAGDGRKAIELCNELNPELVFLDDSLPLLDCESTLEEIVKLEHAPKVILTTTQGRSSVRERAASLGAGMIVRRFAPPTLYREIARVAGVSFEKQMENRQRLMEALDAN